MSFDNLKKVILKTPELWSNKAASGSGLSAHLSGSLSSGGGGVGGSAGMSEIVTTYFSFKDFFKAFKIIAKLGFKNTDDTNQGKFLRLTLHM